MRECNHLLTGRGWKLVPKPHGPGYRLAMDDQTIDWLEQHAKAVFEFGIEARAKLNREVHVTLSFVAVAMATAFGTGLQFYFKDGLKRPGIGLLGLAVYLAAVLAIGVVRCLRVGPVYPPSADPAQLLAYLKRVRTSKDPLNTTRHAELISMQTRIQRNNDRVRELATEFSTLQYLILAAPLVFGMIILVLS